MVYCKRSCYKMISDKNIRTLQKNWEKCFPWCNALSLGYTLPKRRTINGHSPTPSSVTRRSSTRPRRPYTYSPDQEDKARGDTHWWWPTRRTGHRTSRPPCNASIILVRAGLHLHCTPSAHGPIGQSKTNRPEAANRASRRPLSTTR